jgi:hypothetical protein
LNEHIGLNNLSTNAVAQGGISQFLNSCGCLL